MKITAGWEPKLTYRSGVCKSFSVFPFSSLPALILPIMSSDDDVSFSFWHVFPGSIEIPSGLFSSSLSALFQNESGAGRASLSSGIRPNVLHLGWSVHDSPPLRQSLFLLHLRWDARAGLLFSEGKEKSWKSSQGRLLGDVWSAAISRRISPRDRLCKVCARCRRFNFSNELLPWRRLQWGGEGVMATVRQTPREVLLRRCVSQLSSQIFTTSFRVTGSSSGSFTLHLHSSPR